MPKLAGDVDIDFADRNRALKFLYHIPAAIIRNNTITKHNTGVYFHTVPTDPITGLASLHYETAEQQGLYKIDLLNVYVYEMVKNEQHLLDLMSREFDWNLLSYTEFTEKLIHLGKHADMVASLRPKNIQDVAMILALIRPGKRHLVEKCKLNGFDSIASEIWLDSSDGSYSFHKSHATSYAMLVKVHANLIVEQATNNIDSVD
jgi:DNA polymerase III alpha subunit